MDGFSAFVLTPAGHPDPALAIAACRAGAVGVYNAENSHKLKGLEASLARLARYGHAPFGLKLDQFATGMARDLPQWQLQGLQWLVIDAANADTDLRKKAVTGFRKKGGKVLLEACAWDPALLEQEKRMDGWWLKGHEAGGLVGEESSFVLVQQFARHSELPLYVRGGVGIHNAAACLVGGASGIVFDNQLLLLKESPLAASLKGLLRGLSGTETVLIGYEETGRYLRALERPGFEAVAVLREAVQQGQELQKNYSQLRGWQDPQQQVLPLGQDVSLAAAWAEEYGTLANVLSALAQAIANQPADALDSKALAADAPLAELHGTTYPIVQGAMTRVSDSPAFARSVADNGALPMIALAMLKGKQATPILEQTKQLLGDHPWGVGILGFVPKELRDEQMAAIRAVHPPFAYIAGGRPDQALSLEREGITTYLHVPTPALLSLFLDQGAKRFIFEGRECGGHIGPLTSFILWEAMVDLVLKRQQSQGDVAGLCVLFAGGIHDERSAAMVATLAAPLTRIGVRIGVLMGSAYLFTKESVQSGAIKPGFQKVVLECEGTATLTTGPGHASRCAVTPFVTDFHARKREMQHSGIDGNEVRDTLDGLTLGRLRVATKGQMRIAEDSTLHDVPEKIQYDEGMYMIGQVAAMHDQAITMAELHSQVSDRAMAYLADQQPMEEVKEILPTGSADIAIVGVGTLLPGATDARSYWQNIIDSVECISEIPAERWDWRLYYDADRKRRDKIYSKWGGFIEDIPFDPTRYGMPPLSLRSIDPLQLLTLEVVRQALENADFQGAGAVREKVSVILGASGGMGEMGLQYGTRTDLPRMVGKIDQATSERMPEWTEDSFAGLLLNVTSGRAANRFDFGGINCTVDAACASSLAAVYQGVSDLLLGKSDVVVAGGVDTMQSPFAYTCFAKTQALSPRGRCNTFDSEADGIVISEGLSAIVMKRLSDAERDGDRIYAVIKGVGGSSDGRAKGLTAPHPEGQIRALKRAYQEAGYSPATVGLFEAHGTGTVAGDNAELETVSRLLDEYQAAPGSAVIGSVKTMIGHTKAAAGVSGLIKAALALHHKVLPPHLGVTKPLQLLSEPDSPLSVCPQYQPWVQDSSHPRRAGVSAFGFGGTNFHVTVEEYLDDYQDWRQCALTDHWASELFLWRSADRAGLVTALTQLRDSLQAGALPSLRDLAYSLWQSADSEGETIAIIADSLDSLGGKLEAALGYLQSGDQAAPLEGIYHSAEQLDGKMAMLFPGQGAQYPGMLAELASNFPEMVDLLSHADTVLSTEIKASQGYDTRLSRLIYPPQRFTPEAVKAARAALTHTEVAQPAIGAVSTALLELVRGLGISAHMAAGHSYGEYVALYAAGALSLEDLLRLSEARGRFIVEEGSAQDLGTMLAVQAEREQVAALMAEVPDLVLANHNSPCQLVLSGPRMAVEAAHKVLIENDIQATPLPVAAAFHSPLVEPAKTRLAAFMDELDFAPPAFPVYSNTSGTAHQTDSSAVRTQLAEHLTGPVEFVKEINAMYEAGARVFLEVGPKSILTRLVGQILGDKPFLAVALDDRGGGLQGLLHALAALLSQGVKMDLDVLFRGRGVQRLDLDNLPHATREESLPPHAWLVNGSCVRRPGEPCNTGSRPLLTAEDLAQGVGITTTTMPHPQQQQEVAPMSEKPPALTPGIPMPPAGHPDYALAAYHETMRQFLQLQERVMMAHLGAAPAIPMDTSNQTVPTTPVMEPAPVVAAPSQVTEPDATAITSESTSVPVAGAPAPLAEPVAAAPDAAAAPTSGPFDVKSTLLKVASDRTGYPEDMLGLDQDIEADLGIDSIKRVEILGAFQKAMPEGLASSLQANMETITGLRTFQAIIDSVSAEQAGADTAPATAAAEGAGPFEYTGVGSKPCALLPRFVMRAHAEPVKGVPLEQLPSGAYFITEDSLGVAAALAQQLQALDLTVVQIPESVLLAEAELADWLAAATDQPPRGVIHLLPLGKEGLTADLPLAAWRRRMDAEAKSLFNLLRLTGSSIMDGGQVIATSAMGGMFGRDYHADMQAQPAFPAAGGLSGLIKALTFEWNQDINQPNFRAKAVDLDPGEQAEQLAAHILLEMQLPGGRREVGYPAGERTIFRTVPLALTPREKALREPDSDWVVLATGGARGITAEVLREFLPYQPTLVLVGRSPLPPAEDEASRELTDKGALRGYLINQAKAAGETLRPAQIERRISSLLRDREMLANIEDFKAAGARVDYRVVDVRDEQAFTDLLNELYDKYGRIDGVLHGAGIIEDRLLLDKPQDSVARVFDTKVDSAYLLAQNLRPDSLKFLGFFTSVAGRYGNRGQTDYAAGNEVVNRLAWILRARWGDGIKVAAFNWSPWGATTHGVGMVTSEVRQQFEARGIKIIEAAEGRRYVRNELLYGPSDAVELIAGDSSWEYDEARHASLPMPQDPDRVTSQQLTLLQGASLSLESGGVAHLRKPLDLVSDPYLDDHRLDGTPVMPFAGALEYFAESASTLQPDMQVAELADIRLMRGVTLEQEAMPLEIRMEMLDDSGDGRYKVVKATLASQGQKGLPNYSSTVFLRDRLEEAPVYASPLQCRPFDQDMATVYRRWLFHGPMFQTLSEIIGLDEKGIIARVRSTPAALIYPPAAEGTWLFDPTLMDGALQTLLIWSRAMQNSTTLPNRMARVRRFGADPLPAELTLYVTILSDVKDPAIVCTIAAVDDNKRLRILVEKLEGTSSPKLNRLGGAWPGGERQAQMESVEQSIAQKGSAS